MYLPSLEMSSYCWDEVRLAIPFLLFIKTIILECESLSLLVFASGRAIQLGAVNLTIHQGNELYLVITYNYTLH